MTREEILALNAGKALNVCVSEMIMGNRVVADAILGDTEIHSTEQGEAVYGRLMPYSEDLSSAQLVVLRMANLGYTEASLWENEKRPDVICRAALLTILDEEKGKKKSGSGAKLHIVK